MRTPAEIVFDTIRDSKTIPGRLLALTLVLVQFIEGKIADFTLVALTSEAAAVAQVTKMVDTGWVAIGVYIVTGSGSEQARQISSGPLREFTGDSHVEKFLTDLVHCSSFHYEDAESVGGIRLIGLDRARDAQKKRPRFSA